MVKRKRGNNDAEADLSFEESPSSPVESSDDSGDNLGLIEVEMREDDDEEIRSAAAVPIILLDMAEQLYEAGDSKSLTKAITALEKAQTILLHLYPHEKITLEKARTKMATGKLKGKVPPGSSEVIASRLNTRYLLCLIYTLRGRISSLQNFDESNAKTIENLRVALLCYPKSIEANWLLSRSLRIIASDASSMEEVEQLLRKASSIVVVGDKEEVRRYQSIQTSAREALSLLLLQQGRVEQACKYLRSCGFTWRLARDILSYTHESNQPVEDKLNVHVRALDNALPVAAVDHLRYVFRSESPFWSEHQYDVACNASRKVGYFSYKYPFRERKAANSLEQIIDLLFVRVKQMFTRVASDATVAEWWVHSRPHPSGHQLHYDSDETRLEEGGTPSHPICSCVLYLEEDERIGGPTLVTDQTLGGAMATEGWLCFPKLNRLVAFDATLLHGVIPGRGPNPDPSKRRLSFMVGFWSKIEAIDRGENNPGPGQPLPSAASSYTWPKELAPSLNLNPSPSSSDPEAESVTPQHLKRIWEPIDSFKGGSSLMFEAIKLPEYTSVFQGF